MAGQMQMMQPGIVDASGSSRSCRISPGPSPKSLISQHPLAPTWTNELAIVPLPEKTDRK